MSLGFERKLENPHIHEENMQTSHRKIPDGIRTRTFSLRGEPTNHYTTVQPPSLIQFVKKKIKNLVKLIF